MKRKSDRRAALFFYLTMSLLLFFLFQPANPIIINAQEVVTDIPVDVTLSPAHSEVPPPKDQPDPQAVATPAPVEQPDAVTETPETGIPGATPAQPGGDQSGQPAHPAGTGTQNVDNTQYSTTSPLFSPVFQIGNIVLLIIITAALALYYYKNYMLNLRIHRLEILVEKRGMSPLSGDEPIPFSWEQALKSLEGGWPLLSHENRIYQPGLVLISPDNPDLAFCIASNLIYRTIGRENRGAIFLSKTRGENELARGLLAIESGVAPGELPPGEREELIRRYSMEMSKYERGLFIFQDFNISVDSLYEQINRIMENVDIGLVVIDGRSVVSSEDFEDLVSRLRIISIKTYIPIVLIESLKPEEREKVSGDSRDRMTAFISVTGTRQSGEITLNNEIFNGDAPPDKMKIDPNTGEITIS